MAPGGRYRGSPRLLDNDFVAGGTGSDDVDDSQAGSDRDDLRGEDAADVVNGKDGDTSDSISGGPGTDTCFRDPPPEGTQGCENIR